MAKRINRNSTIDLCPSCDYFSRSPNVSKEVPVPRFLVYVNTHSDKNHITVHAETSKPCGSVFQQVHSAGAYATEGPVQRLDKNTVKIAEAENSHWLLIWCDSLQGVYQNQHVVLAAAQLSPGRKPSPCSHCQ